MSENIRIIARRQIWLSIAQLGGYFNMSARAVDGVLGYSGLIRATGEPTDRGKRICAKKSDDGRQWLWNPKAVEQWLEGLTT